jgi:hypothetical protein
MALATEKTSMTAQLVGRMLAFLGLKSKAGKATRQVEADAST